MTDGFKSRIVKAKTKEEVAKELRRRDRRKAMRKVMQVHHGHLDGYTIRGEVSCEDGIAGNVVKHDESGRRVIVAYTAEKGGQVGAHWRAIQSAFDKQCKLRILHKYEKKSDDKTVKAFYDFDPLEIIQADDAEGKDEDGVYWWPIRLGERANKDE